MIGSMAEAKSRRNASSTDDRQHGLHDHGSVDEAQAALENSALRHAALDDDNRVHMAKWMWRNDASPEEAALAFGVDAPDGVGWPE